MIGIGKHFTRYIKKNTISGQYARHTDAANLFAIGTGAEVLKIACKNFELADVGIIPFLGTLTLKNLRLAIKNFKDLRPIKVRAIQIKKCRKSIKTNTKY